MDRGSSRIFVEAKIPQHQSLFGMLVFVLVAMTVGVHATSNVTILESAISKGAVCLDGSAPSYSYVKGSGNGSQSWIVSLRGGGWCYTVDNCIGKKNISIGSSRIPYTGPGPFDGFMDSSCTTNPDFCNWHKVFIFYCDGSSFTSDVNDSKTDLYFRGARIFKAMMEEMLSKGMGYAKDAILTGTSAGGLSTMLHCDGFRSLFPNTSRVKCISDSGFFIRGEGHYGDKQREGAFASVIKTHELANYLPRACTSKRNSSLCLFPEYFAGDIKTPLMVVESAFDAFQVTYNLLGKGNCTNNTILSCNSTELGIIRDFAKTFRSTLDRVIISNSSSRGLFVHSFYVHGHFVYGSRWTCIALANKTIGQSVADWYFERSYVREIDTKNDAPRKFIDGPNCPLLSLNHTSVASVTHSGLMSFLFFFVYWL